MKNYRNKIIIKILKSEYLKVFFFGFLMAFLSFIIILIKGKGLFVLCNDFRTQQIPFNMLVNESIKKGDIFWNWYIDLGSNFTGSMGFYPIGSPFAWLGFLFPAKLFPYVIAWTFMLKYAVASVTSYAYIKRYVNSKTSAACGAFLYAFSGFQTVNLMFPFHDAVAFFPLLLIGIDKLLYEKKKGIFALTVAINALVNYFFFIQSVVFLILYFLCKQGIKLLRVHKQILQCMWEGILGIFMAGVIFFPSLLFIMDNPRLNKLIQIKDWLYTGRRDYLRMIRTTFFPADIMSSQSFLSKYDYSSWSLYLPMVSLSLVIGYIIRKKWDWISRIIIIGLLCTAVPLLNSVFSFFSAQNYYRWVHMLILIAALATSKVLESKKEYPVKSSCILCGGVMLGVSAMIYGWSFNKSQLILRPRVFFALTVIGIGGVVCTLIILSIKKNKFKPEQLILIGIAVFSIITTGFCAELNYRLETVNSIEYYDKMQTLQKLHIPDNRYRFITEEYDNITTMTVPVSGTSSFSSTINGSITEFYNSLGYARKVLSINSIEGKSELLSGKYYISDKRDENNKMIQILEGNYNNYYVYEKEDAFPIGSAYDVYITKSNFNKIAVEKRAVAMLKCLVIDDSMEEKVSKSMVPYSEIKHGNFDGKDKDEVIKLRNKEASNILKKDNLGFSSQINTSADKYAFFSVPYDKGWKCKVNGTKTEIISVNGLMAIPIFKGANEIRFNYMDYKLLLGFFSTIIAGVIWIIIYKSSTNHKNSPAEGEN